MLISKLIWFNIALFLSTSCLASLPSINSEEENKPSFSKKSRLLVNDQEGTLSQKDEHLKAKDSKEEEILLDFTYRPKAPADLITEDNILKKSYQLRRLLNTQPNIVAIRFNNHQIGDKGAWLLSAVLKDHPSITSLDFSNNNIGNKGASALSNLGHLKKLHLKANQIETPGALALIEGLRFSTVLTELNLKDNPIQMDKNLKSLIEKLDPNISVSLSHSLVSENNPRPTLHSSSFYITQNREELIQTYISDFSKIPVNSRPSIIKSSIHDSFHEEVFKRLEEYEQTLSIDPDAAISTSNGASSEASTHSAQCSQEQGMLASFLDFSPLEELQPSSSTIAELGENDSDLSRKRKTDVVSSPSPSADIVQASLNGSSSKANEHISQLAGSSSTELLGSGSAIQALYLEGKGGKPGNHLIEFLTYQLRSASHLTSIGLVNFGLDDADFFYLFQSFMEVPNNSIETITLSHNKLTDESIKGLTVLLENSIGLTVLNISHNSFKFNEISVFFDFLSKLTTPHGKPKEINLQGNYLNPTAIQFLTVTPRNSLTILLDDKILPREKLLLASTSAAETLSSEEPSLEPGSISTVDNPLPLEQQVKPAKHRNRAYEPEDKAEIRAYVKALFDSNPFNHYTQKELAKYVSDKFNENHKGNLPIKLDPSTLRRHIQEDEALSVEYKKRTGSK
ncbi:MAG: hypothetical protein IBJ00_00820 [Alphaproteobacteria bacterium]|nr:hypothetical protein [Alphaproteobacteria bacterium]